jgi:prefoldin beta subunit
LSFLWKQDFLQAKNKDKNNQGRVVNMKEIDETKIQEMQILEQKLQNSMMQRQSFEMELAETNSALEEIKKSGDEVFKIIGQLMIKSEKSKIKEELLNKNKILELRIKAFEKQEVSLGEQLEKLRDEITKSMHK